jgi:hypothetical protein
MNWGAYPPFARLLICFGILFIIEIIGLLFGALALKINEACDEREAEQKQKAQEPVDCTGIDFVYDNKAEIKQIGHELRGLTRRKEKEG